MFPSIASCFRRSLMVAVVVTASATPVLAQFPGQSSRPNPPGMPSKTAPVARPQIPTDWRPVAEYFQVSNARMGRDGYNKPALLFDVEAKGNFEDPGLWAIIHLRNTSRPANEILNPQVYVVNEIVHFNRGLNWRTGMRGVGSIQLPDNGPGSPDRGSVITGIRFAFGAPSFDDY